MTTRKKMLKPVPEFKSTEEEARFWETHDTTEYDLEDVAEPLKLSPKLKSRIRARWRRRRERVVHLTPKQVQKIQEIARCKGIDFERLVRQWVQEGIRKELTT